MSDPKRYFVNRLSEEAVAVISGEERKKHVESLISTIVSNFTISPRNIEGGLYVGLAGLSYMFYHVSKISYFCAEERRTFLNNAVRYLRHVIQHARQNANSCHITEKTGFLTGNVGVYAVAAVVFRTLGMTVEFEDCVSKLSTVSNVLKRVDWFKNGGDELFVGRAGFLCAIFWIKNEIGYEVLLESEVDLLLNTTLESGLSYAKAVRSPLPLIYHYYDTQYLGPAHGLSGILFVMLNFPAWLDRNPSHKQTIKACIDALIQFQTPEGNFPCAMDEVGQRRHPDEELVHWCHGAPGTIYLLAKAYDVFREEKYLNSALKCGEITWKKGLLKKGPGICHGVSGSGYVFLMLYRLTKDLKHLRRAQQFMAFMYSDEFKRARTPDCQYSLFEGLAGTVCFAADLLEPDKANFPLFPIC